MCFSEFVLDFVELAIFFVLLSTYSLVRHLDRLLQVGSDLLSFRRIDRRHTLHLLDLLLQNLNPFQVTAHILINYLEPLLIPEIELNLLIIKLHNLLFHEIHS